ncbi:GTPase [Candidatus Lokiarchaeum ossiferum]|uniref:GTPase n=1 Tax=Candidatus Lokiarchaeum ossiferum TaxID=2951803 RepID=UPI00352D28DB
MKTGKHWQDIFATVIKETDFVLEILDSRNPIGTHNKMIETFLLKNRPEIQLILILNKSDIIPREVLKEWKLYFKSQGYKVFSCSAKHHKGVMNLLKEIRHLGTRPNTNMLIVGYPNTGKSTLIESLTKNEKKVGTSARAGFTRVIQKIKLTNNVFLIDTPGVIPINEKDETDMAIKACMVADKVNDPMGVVEAIFKLLPKKQFNSIYGINLDKNDGPEKLVFEVGKKSGLLISGGKINEPEAQKLLIRDWQSNKLKYYSLPPSMIKKEKSEPILTEQPKYQKNAQGIPKSLRKRKKKSS